MNELIREEQKDKITKWGIISFSYLFALLIEYNLKQEIKHNASFCSKGAGSNYNNVADTYLNLKAMVF